MKLFVSALPLCSLPVPFAAEPRIHDKTGFFVHLTWLKRPSTDTTPLMRHQGPGTPQLPDSQGREHVLDWPRAHRLRQ